MEGVQNSSPEDLKHSTVRSLMETAMQVSVPNATLLELPDNLREAGEIAFKETMRRSFDKESVLEDNMCVRE